MRLTKATPALARRQASWLVGEEPWRGLGYQAAPLGRWLARKGRAGHVRCAVAAAQVLGVIVVQPDVLLGHFIALLAVVPATAGRGVGRALIDDADRRARAARVRWLYTSSDAGNRAAAGFYRRMGFQRVATLPDLLRDGRAEWLWRRRVGPA